MSPRITAGPVEPLKREPLPADVVAAGDPLLSDPLWRDIQRELAPFPPHSIIHAAENIKGGVGTYLRELLALQGRQFGPGVVTAIVPESQRAIVQSPPGVQIVTFDDRGHRLLSTVRLAACTRSIVAHSAARVVHLHSTFAGAALRPMLRAIRTTARVIYCAHGWAFDRDSSKLSRGIARALERSLAGACDAIVCISGHEMRAALAIGIPASKLVQVSNGIPAEPPQSPARFVGAHWPYGKRRILFVGRFDRQKGVDVLLSALSELQGRAFCYLAGDRVLGDAPLPVLPANARMTGWLPAPDLEVFYRSADVIVVPSRWEGFGLIAAEAMRAGLPVIASGVGGLTEVVKDGVTGILVPPDNPAALARALRSTSDSQLEAMGRAGRQRFLERFTLERVHGQLTQLYRDGVPTTAARRLSGSATRPCRQSCRATPDGPDRSRSR